MIIARQNIKFLFHALENLNSTENFSGQAYSSLLLACLNRLKNIHSLSPKKSLIFKSPSGELLYWNLFAEKWIIKAALLKQGRPFGVQEINPEMFEFYYADDMKAKEAGDFIKCNNLVFYHGFGNINTEGIINPFFDQDRGDFLGTLIEGSLNIQLRMQNISQALKMINFFGSSPFVKKARYKLSLGHYLISFSRRECEILLNIFTGKTNEQIGASLGIEKRTVENYLTNIKNKIGLSKKPEIIDSLIQNSFLELF